MGKRVSVRYLSPLPYGRAVKFSSAWRIKFPLDRRQGC